MPAAYDVEGRLKKHALLGTSLAVDPYRSEQRQQFEELQNEAQLAEAAGPGGRQEMLNRLQGKFETWASPQISRLQEMANRRQLLQEATTTVRDPNKEVLFDLYNQWAKFPKPKAAPKTADDLYYAGMPREFLNQAQKEWKDQEIVSQAAFREANNISAKYAFAEYAKQRWDEEYGKAAQRVYQNYVDEEVDRLQGVVRSLDEEEAGRNQRIANRIELYNMFLGQDPTQGFGV